MTDQSTIENLTKRVSNLEKLCILQNQIIISTFELLQMKAATPTLDKEEIEAISSLLQ